MVEQINTHGLRELPRAPLGSGTHGDISTRFEALGVIEAETDGARTKAERVDVVLAALNDHDMARVAQRLLSAHGMTPSLRNRIQDTLWAGQPPLVVERVRRELSRELELSEAVVDAERFEALFRPMVGAGPAQSVGRVSSCTENSHPVTFGHSVPAGGSAAPGDTQACFIQPRLGHDPAL